MGIVLNTPQREQAGSIAYNRFEYQVHWTVFHIVEQLEKNPECIVFCEYHDDVSDLKEGKGSPFEFYQIKTKDNLKEWTICELSAKEKKKDGNYKKSFLGFVFYNFLTFGEECRCCYFVSNCAFDKEVVAWQACIEDEGILKDCNPELYYKIKERIKSEYKDNMPNNFDDVFDRFIQKTFISKSELQLEAYEKQLTGHFFDFLKDNKIPAGTAYMILQQIINDVRKKNKTKVDVPISFRSLVEKKGICVSDIKSKLEEKEYKVNGYDGLIGFLQKEGIDNKRINRLIDAKQTHDMRWLNVDDLKYQQTVIAIKCVLESMYESADLEEVKKQCDHNLKQKGLESFALDEDIVEVLYYERRYRNSRE